MKKKLLTLFLIVTMVISLAIPALASPREFKDGTIIISPMFTYISTARARLYINSSGNATVETYLTGNSEVTRSTATINLQQYKAGRWTTIKTWNESSSSNILNFSSTYNVSSGYEYRVQSTVTAYSGTQSESTTVTSSSQSY